MAIIVPNEGIVQWLKYMLRIEPIGTMNMVLRLYQNDYNPGPETTLSDLTECDFTNYVPIELTNGEWGEIELVANRASSTWGASPIIWTCGIVGNTVYGLYLTDLNSDALLGVERFPTAFVLSDGTPFFCQPTYTTKSEFTS